MGWCFPALAQESTSQWWMLTPNFAYNQHTLLKQSYRQGFTGILLYNLVRTTLEKLGNIFTFIILITIQFWTYTNLVRSASDVACYYELF